LLYYRDKEVVSDIAFSLRRFDIRDRDLLIFRIIIYKSTIQIQML
jgi:hypothetical protein